MTDQERIDKLAQHFQGMIRETFRYTVQEDMADGVRADPQAHIDALVEAGILSVKSGIERKAGPGSPFVPVLSHYVVQHPIVPCRHCGEDVEPCDSATGTGWKHSDTGERQCHTVAEPEEVA